MNNRSHIYLVTVFEKCEYDSKWGADLGSTRSVCFTHSLEEAGQIVKTNMCDIWEYTYDLACIEELGTELYPIPHERWFFGYNEKSGRYEPIDEPFYLSGRKSAIGAIG